MPKTSKFNFKPLEVAAAAIWLLFFLGLFNGLCIYSELRQWVVHQWNSKILLCRIYPSQCLVLLGPSMKPFCITTTTHQPGFVLQALIPQLWNHMTQLFWRYFLHYIFPTSYIKKKSLLDIICMELKDDPQLIL